MRDILFKAVEQVSFGKTRHWIIGDLCRHYVPSKETFHYTIINPYSGMSKPVDCETVCEFTGFLDRNEEVVFEHDLVMVSQEFIDPWVGQVEWFDGHFCIVQKNDSDEEEEEDNDIVVDLADLYPHEYKVVGNAYDYLTVEKKAIN